MPWSIDARFDIPDNREVVALVRANPTLSAHDEVAEALTRSARGLPDVQSYCPDVHAYAYVVLHTPALRIFALAVGQRGLVYRLPPALGAEAVGEGGRVWEDLGPAWVMFDPWAAGRPLDAARWCRAAHAAALARESSQSRRGS